MTDPHRDEFLLSLAEAAARGEPICDGDVKRLGETWIELAQQVDTHEIRRGTVRRVASNIAKATAEGDFARTERALQTLREAGLL